MINSTVEHSIEVWGDFACFSRPELKVERWSYPCPTPSAARGVFDSIYCHAQQFRWQITKIELLTQPSYIPLRRNEVKEKANRNAINKWMAGIAEPEPILADADKSMTGSDKRGRTQRQTMALREPRFRIEAFIVPWPSFENRFVEFNDQFERRLKKGKCFQQPYLGCREFVAFFEKSGSESPVPFTQDVGFMLYDVFDLRKQNKSDANPFISVFSARIENGCLGIPPFEDKRVLKPEEGE